MKFPVRLWSLAICLATSALIARAADPSAAEVAKAFPTADGFAVQVGADNGAFLADLTNSGKRSVHGLCLDDKTRDTVRAVLHEKAVFPLASVATWSAAPRLPYADRLVNLLIVDRDALGANAPTVEECTRVVAPEGVILARSGGTWKTTTIPRPATFGNWSHFDGGPDGNAVASDKEATGINTLQWIENARPARWIKTGPHGGLGGNIRIWGRYAVIDSLITAKDTVLKDTDYPRVDHNVIECRDVSNGLPLWQFKRDERMSRKRWALVVDQGLCFTYLANKKPLSAIDLATGEIKFTYPGSEVVGYRVTDRDGKVGTYPGIRSETHWVRVTGNTVIANGYGSIRAWTLEGKPLWTFSREGASAEIPVIDEARGLVYAMLVKENNAPRYREDAMFFNRWPTSENVLAFVAIDLATGKLKWENTELASRPTDFIEDKKEKRVLNIGWGQLLVAGDHLIAMNTATIGGGNMLLVASMNPLTGKTVAFDPTTFLGSKGKEKASFDGGVRCVAYRDGKVYVLGSSAYYLFDPVNGTKELVSNMAWNARCIRPLLTQDYVILGHTAFIGKDHGGEFYASARSGCNISPVPGAGLILYGPHTCACVTALSGHFATSSRPVGKPLADDKRLVKLKPTSVPVPTPVAESPKSLISENWSWFTMSVSVLPRTSEINGWQFTINPQQYRIDASGPDNKSWSYIADTRIGTNIAVTADRVVFGSHDGYVTALNLTTGEPVWKYLLAPSHRLIFANGLLSSTWPVFGVADMGNGQILASAGLHAEYEGGVTVASLNASDGSLVWVKHLGKPPSTIGPGGGYKNVKIVDKSVVNAPPKFENGKVIIAGGGHLSRFEFTPDESEESLNKRLASPPEKVAIPKK